MRLRIPTDASSKKGADDVVSGACGGDDIKSGAGNPLTLKQRSAKCAAP